MRRRDFLTGVVLAMLAVQTAVSRTRTNTSHATTTAPRTSTSTTTPSIVNQINTNTNTTTSTSTRRTGVNASRFDAATMRAALRTTPVEERGFIDRVLYKVRKGILPADLVDTTFVWAKRKPRHRFQYFKYGLIYRANELGVRL
jgi:hypothetical protein